MRNFPTLFWTRFQEYKDAPAIITLDEKGRPQTTTFWEWTRRIQNLAIAMMEAGFQPEDRIGLIAPNHRDLLDLTAAAWLLGGAVVPLPPGRDRKETLRCLGRSGTEWIVVVDPTERDRLAGPGGQLPGHLKWIFLQDAPARENFFSLSSLEEEGRTLARRGRTRQLAERIYQLKPSNPTLILFDPHPGPDAQGAFFSGKKVAAQLEAISHQLAIPESGASSLSALSFGWFPGFLNIMATLFSGNPVVLPSSLREFSREIDSLKPTHLFVGPAYLESLAQDWQDRLEKAPDLLKKLAGDDPQPDSTLGKTLSSLGSLGDFGERALRRFLYDPIRAEFGGNLEAIYVFGGHCPAGLHDILEKAGVVLLGQFGIPEAGITHIEHPRARRPNSVGRPIEGIATKIAGAKTGESGELCLRGDLLFDGYWAGTGPLQFDDDGWLRTGTTARLESGFAFLETPPAD